MKKLIFVILCLGMLTACHDKSQYQDKQLIQFTYNFRPYFDGYWYYRISMEEETRILEAEDKNGVDLNIDREIDSKVFMEIQQIINR